MENQDLVELFIHPRYCRDPRPDDLARFGLSAQEANPSTYFELNSHVMTSHYKYYLIRGMVTPCEGKDEETTVERTVRIVAKKVDSDDGDGDDCSARPMGGFRRTYFLCDLVEER
jgi:hypothetical protein